MSVTTTCRDISELTPNAQKACNLFMQKCKEQGLNVLITETYRSQARQNYLYEQGRTRPGNIVTWTKNSRHTSRRAWDICKNVKGQEYSDSGFFKKCGNIAKELGIVWGGTWATPDTPHFEIAEDWTYKEDEPMTAEEKTKFNELVNIVSDLKASQEKVYRWMQEVPEDYRPTIEKLWYRGIYKGASPDNLRLNETLARAFTVLDRAGFFDL